MCGIAGIVSLSSRSENICEQINLMVEKIKHRGPDDAGFTLFNSNLEHFTSGNSRTCPDAWTSPYVYAPKHSLNELSENYPIALGHTRLSVIDTSVAGHQPMCIPSGDIWITLNGEIYNYIELRQELETLGCSFQTHSDTEVLLVAYQTWGIDCLKKLNGMWSFVIFDKQKQLLIGARDRTGVKPFYIYKNKSVFCWASEIKAIAATSFYDSKINESAVFKYLLQGTTENDGKTFFSDIEELPPAHYFTFQLKSQSFNIQQYWNLDINRANDIFDQSRFNKYTEEVRELAIASIDKRLRSDIPVGFCLSGGIDSSSIVCMANHLQNKQKHGSINDRLVAFTAVNHVAGFDETKWAEIIVKKLGIDWVKTDCNASNLIDLLPEMNYYQDTPIVSTSTYAQYKVMEAAKNKGIPVLIDGQGGDELFAGYVPFYTSLYWQFIRNGNFKGLKNELKHLGNSPFSKSLFATSSAKIIAQGLIPNNLKKQFLLSSRPETDYLQRDYLKQQANKFNIAGNFSNRPLNDLLAEYYSGYFLKNLLRWEDRCSMRFSIESRTPFADDLPLIEKLFSIPAVYKINNGWNKSLLRSAMQDILPDEIRLRTDKMGFSTPQSNWLVESKDALINGITEMNDSSNLLNRAKFNNKLNGIFDRKDNKQMQFAFRYYNFLLWQKAFEFTS